MNYLRTSSAVDILGTLREIQADWQASDVWRTTWPLIQRMLDREHEMMLVWENIARNKLSWQQCHCLLEQMIFAGKYGTDEYTTHLKKDFNALKTLNDDIRSIAEKLAQMLAEREDILNRNSFSMENTIHIVDMIDHAAAGNGHYRSWVREPLRKLGENYGIKYWPSLQDVLQTVAWESPTIEVIHESDRAIISVRGEAVPNYLRELLSGIETVRTGHWGLPGGFTLSNANLATLATVTLDLQSVVTTDAVKMLLHRLRKEGFSAAWATQRKKSVACKLRKKE
ncbi:hypothetical protein [Dickeya dadantii]|uniref:hypothetical protein n=1 Tax=Dickeya dadantii TaxID=204038 RepID=UPI0021D8B734|nr:hypothetical protein [Dickeya dadantii]